MELEIRWAVILRAGKWNMAGMEKGAQLMAIRVGWKVTLIGIGGAMG
jgi:hypothetical protein